MELDLIYTPSRNSHLTFVNSIRFVVIQVSSVASFHVIVKLSTTLLVVSSVLFSMSAFHFSFNKVLSV